MVDATTGPEPLTTGFQKVAQLSSTTSSPALSDEQMLERRKAIAACLAKLALHYWRPDFSAMQAKALFSDFVHDLEFYTASEIETACATYRRKPTSEFFPKVGQLLDLLNAARRDQRLQSTVVDFNDRPLGWYMWPRSRWRADWSENDVPERYRSLVSRS